MSRICPPRFFEESFMAAARKFMIAGLMVLMCGAAPAYAEKPYSANNPDTPVMKEMTIKKWKKRSTASKKAQAPLQQHYRDLRDLSAAKKAETIPTIATKDLNIKNSAATLLGAYVKDSQGKNTATIQDIIMKKNGRAQTVVLKDLGRLSADTKIVAIDYKTIVNTAQAPATVLKPMSGDAMDKIAPYEVKPGSGLLSSALLIGAEARNSVNQTMALVEDILFTEGRASEVVFSSHNSKTQETEYSVLKFGDIHVIITDSAEPYILLRRRQAAFFDAYPAE